MDISLKRIIAYLLDFLLIVLISTIITSIPLINPYKDEYAKAYQKYVNVQDDASVDQLAKVNYDLSKYGVVTTCVSIIVIFIYFGIFQYFYKGQTVGKKIMKLQIVSNNEKDLTIWHYMFRAIILNNIIFRIMIVIAIFLLSYKAYNGFSITISFIENAILITIVSMVLFKKNNRGLHDILCRTKVISLKEEKVIEGKVKN